MEVDSPETRHYNEIIVLIRWLEANDAWLEAKDNRISIDDVEIKAVVIGVNRWKR